MSAGHTSTGLVVRQVTIARGGRPVVHRVNLSVEPGCVTALLGANGAGKSSLVLALAGALPVLEGQVLLNGAPVQNRPPHVIRRLGVAAVPEGHRVLRDLNVDENLRAAAAHLSRRELAATLEEAYETFPELHERRASLAGKLSGGQQQMVAIAQALVGKPDFILADELSFGLAPVVVARLVPVLVGFAQRGGGVLLIEQFTHVALKVAHRVHVMDRGEIVFSGMPDELERNPDILHSAYLTAV